VPPDTTTVTGTERIGWDQEVPGGTRGAVPVYAAYLDGARVDFPGVSCKPRSATMYDCSAPLPDMQPGLHTLRLASIEASEHPLQSPRSRALHLLKVGPSGETAAIPSAAKPPSTPGTFAIDVISDSNGPIADIAVTPDGVVFAAESGGRILTSGRDGLVEALQIRDLARGGGLGLFSIALHPEFEKTHLVYFAYAAESATGPVWRLARGREVNGRIGEVAVLVDGEPVAQGSSAVIRFGPDRHLYAALGADQPPQPRAGSYNGRLLRLTEEGRRGTNNTDGSPVVDSVQGAPMGLTWTPEVRLLQTRTGDRYELTIAQGGNVLNRFTWPNGRKPTALTYSSVNGGWLYFATLDRGLQRVRWPQPKGAAGLDDATIAAEYTGVRAVAAGADGSIYFGTANSPTDSSRGSAESGKNYVIRLKPR
jgi:hypothetical protein